MPFQVEMLEKCRKNLCRDKQTTNNVPVMFLRLKWLRKGTNCIFQLCQQKTRVQCTFRNFKISRKIGQQLS